MKIDFEKVLKDYGLKVGNKVEIKEGYHNPYTIDYEAIHCRGWRLLDSNKNPVYLDYLINNEFEKVKENKKVGDLRCCREIKCENCPLHCINCNMHGYVGLLFEIWEDKKERFPDLAPMKEWIEKELNEEVEE